MTELKDPTSRWTYMLLFGIQTIGCVLVYWKVLPLYRQLVGDPTTFEAQVQIRIWIACGILLIQAGHWVRWWKVPGGAHLELIRLPRFVKAVSGQFMLFMARIVFVPATAIFSFVFILTKLGDYLLLYSYVFIFVGLFSLFLYSQELVLLGNELMAEKAK
jgi:hypothetical protein